MVITTGVRLRRACGIAIAMVTLVSCADWSQLAFRQDHRLRFIAPANGDVVRLPLKLNWTMDDFRIVRPGSGTGKPSAGYFAIFIDETPMEPGRTLRELAAEDDPSCEQDPQCPDREYLADRGIYTTTKTSLRLRSVLPLSSDEPTQLHDVTVVLLDAAGSRIGESAWHLQFKLRKRTFG